MRNEILELINDKHLTESQICEGFIEILQNNKKFLSKNDRVIHLADIILTDQIFE